MSSKKVRVRAQPVSPHGETVVALEIPIDQIFPDPHQPRKRFKQVPLEELAESIKNQGTQQPPTVNFAGIDKKGEPFYYIKAGERRWRANKANGAETMLCIVLPGVYVAERSGRRVLAQTSENFAREPHTHGEIIDVILLLIEEALEEEQGNRIGIVGRVTEEVAQAFGKKKSWAEGYYRLTRLVPELRELLDSENEDERISLQAGVSLSSIPADDQLQVWEDAKGYYEKLGHTGVVRHILKEARRIAADKGISRRGRKPSDETKIFTRMLNGFERMGHNFCGDRKTGEHQEYVRKIVRGLKVRDLDALLKSAEHTLTVVTQIRDELKRRSNRVHNTEE